MQKNTTVVFIYYVFLILLYQALTAFSSITPSHLQVGLLVFVLLPFLKLKVSNHLLPKFIIISTFVLSMSWYVVLGIKHKIVKPKILVAQLSDDTYGKNSRIFIQNLNKQFKREQLLSAGSLNYSLSDSKEAYQLLEEKDHLQAVIWGNNDWLLYASEYRGVKPIKSFRLTKELPLDLQIIQDVPVIGVSYQPSKRTIAYFSRLLSSYHVDSDLQEIYLRSVGQFPPHWSQSTHLAYGNFLLANHLFFQLLDKNEFEKGLYRCAIDAYAKSASFIVSHYHPELTAAVNNNIAVINYVKYLFTNSNKERKDALTRLKSAKESGKIKNPLNMEYISPNVARYNLKQIKGVD